MKVESQAHQFTLSSQANQSDYKRSNAAASSHQFSDANDIKNIADQNVVSSYFDIFDENFSEVTIKNLISARLQPAYKLPQIHDSKALSAKANELLNFSIAI